MEIVIEQLPINDPLEVRGFVNIGDEMGSGESASIGNIVEVMNEQEGCKSEEEDRKTEVKTNDAIVRVDNVVKYIQQNNLGVSASLMKNLHSLKRFIMYESIEKKKQVTLEKFVESSIQAYKE